jgi:hypothetical protein
MHKLVLLFFFTVGIQAHAAIGAIACVATQFEISKGGLKDYVEKPLNVDRRDSPVVTMNVDIGERAYVLSGDLVSGDFLLTQAWGQDYTTGINMTGSFNSSGRMTISMVEGNKVFKLECTKTLASDFPRE